MVKPYLHSNFTAEQLEQFHQIAQGLTDTGKRADIRTYVRQSMPVEQKRLFESVVNLANKNGDLNKDEHRMFRHYGFDIE